MPSQPMLAGIVSHALHFLPAASLLPPVQTCSADMAVAGGQVDGVPSAGPIQNALCPAGSYSSSQDVLDPNGIPYCMPCPAGYYCSGGVKTACPANTENALLGQDASSGCKLCSANTYGTNTGFTSNAGAAYCTVPAVDTQCLDDTVGKEYDPASQACVPCQAGTYRPTGGSDITFSCLPW